jgi:hypothetical protein
MALNVVLQFGHWNIAMVIVDFSVFWKDFRARVGHVLTGVSVLVAHFGHLTNCCPPFSP